MRHPFIGSPLKFVFCFLLVFTAIIAFAAPPKAKKGVLDIHSLDLNRNRVALSGAWIFLDNQLVSPAHVFNQRNERHVDSLKPGIRAAYRIRDWIRNLRSQSRSASRCQIARNGISPNIFELYAVGK